MMEVFSALFDCSSGLNVIDLFSVVRLVSASGAGTLRSITAARLILHGAAEHGAALARPVESLAAARWAALQAKTL
jgi:hypothetical protein